MRRVRETECSGAGSGYVKGLVEAGFEESKIAFADVYQVRDHDRTDRDPDHDCDHDHVQGP